VKIISESLRERAESFDSKDAAYSDLEVNIAIFDFDSYRNSYSSYDLERLIGSIWTFKLPKS
jgi:hypothetical protein